MEILYQKRSSTRSSYDTAGSDSWSERSYPRQSRDASHEICDTGWRGAGDVTGMARSALGHLSWARGRCGGSVAGAIVRVGNPRERETMREREMGWLICLLIFGGLLRPSYFWLSVENMALFLAVGPSKIRSF
jgi:hypothetical protein